MSNFIAILTSFTTLYMNKASKPKVNETASKHQIQPYHRVLGITTNKQLVKVFNKQLFDAFITLKA